MPDSGADGGSGVEPWYASAGYALGALAGGYGLGFFLWVRSQRDLLPSFIRANELPGDQRATLLASLLLGAALALAVWIAVGLLARRSHRDVAAGLAGSGSLLGLLSLLAWLPVLALPGLEQDQPFLTLGLIGSLALVAFVCVNQALYAWQRLTLADLVDVPVDPPGHAPTADTGGATRPAASQAGLSWLSGRLTAALLLVVILILGYTVFMSVLTVARHNAFMTHAFDLGIHDQVVYNVLYLGYPRSTQHGAQAINYLREHFAPILYLLAPFYALRPEATTLLGLQSCLLAVGALPVYLLGRRKTGSIGLAIALAASYLLYPALQGINTFDFHQVVPATALLLFSLYFLETDRLIPFLVTLGLALLAKEEVALTGAAIGLYTFWVKRRHRLGILVMLACLAYFVTVVKFAMPALGGAAQVNRFEGLMAPGSRGFGGVFMTLLTNPWYVAQFVLTNPSKLLYLGQLFLPVCFLPFLAGGAWVVALPPLAMALLSSAETQYTIGYHYPATLVPGVYFLAVLGAARLNPLRYRRQALAVAVLVASLAMNYEYGWVLSKGFTGFPQPSQHQAAVAALLREIPPAAAVSSLSDLVPHVSNRQNIYLFPTVNDADYLALDTDPTANFWPFIGASGRSDAQQAIAPYLIAGQYGVVKIQDGALLAKRGYPTTQNGEGLQALFGARYEAEDQPGNYGAHNLADPAASAGLARVGEPNLPHEPGKNALIYGPYDTLLPGNYRVTFWLKLAGSPVTGKIARVDVFSGAAGGVLAGTDVAAADFQAGLGYQPFVVDLEIDRAWSDLEYRVLYAGKGQLWVDSVQVVPTRVALPGSNQVLDLPQP